MTYTRVERVFSAYASDAERLDHELETSFRRPDCLLGTPEGLPPPSWASLSFAETSRDLPPLESGAVALEDQFCGWLWMRGARLGRWRHRYFCLDGAMLSYFTSFPAEVFLKQAQASVASAWTARNLFHFGDAAQPRGVMRVAHVDDTDRSNRVGFKVYGACGKVIDIRAHDAQERNRWLRALKTPARRRSRCWSVGSSEELTVSMASFDPDGLCLFDRMSISISKSGWMEKKSSFLGLWRRYFFVVQGAMMSYYASDKPYEVPRWRGYIQGVKIRRRSASAISASMGTSTASPSLELLITLDSPQPQVLHVRVRTAEEVQEWRSVLLSSLPHRTIASVTTA
ncbi:hypothetical protein BBJ28_00007892 [Nothophytophthora sp. Chile5]|nr:hypothetical protein BBJ28_00007892 [Nothophytophthora sp. Chile5]